MRPLSAIDCPKDAAARLILAQILSRQRDYEGAIEQYKAALEGEAGNARILYFLAEAYATKANGNRLAPERGEALRRAGAPGTLPRGLAGARGARLVETS